MKLLIWIGGKKLLLEFLVLDYEFNDEEECDYCIWMIELKSNMYSWFAK